MIRRPPRSTLDRSSAASDVYKRQAFDGPFDAATVSNEAAPDLGVGADLTGRAFLALCVNDPVLVVEVQRRLLGKQAHVGFPVCLHRANTVSYTHLRAHETVLDLVCRLLLEKKKTNTHDTA